MGIELFRNPGRRGAMEPRRCRDQELHPPAAHLIPAPGGQAASITAEATAAYGALMSQEFSATGKVFCPLWQCQQLPRPQPYCEILCSGERERGRLPERGSKTVLGARGQRQRQSWGLRVISEGKAPREGCSELQDVEREALDKGQPSCEHRGQDPRHSQNRLCSCLSPAPHGTSKPSLSQVPSVIWAEPRA